MTGSNGTKLWVVAGAAVLGAACGSGTVGIGSTSSGSAHGGTGGTTSHAASVAVAVATSVGAGGMSSAASGGMSSAASGGMSSAAGTGGGAPACNPPAGSFYAQSAQQYGNPTPTSMCDYKGDVLLVVNIAAV